MSEIALAAARDPCNASQAMPLSRVISKFRGKHPVLDRIPTTIEMLFCRPMRDVEVKTESGHDNQRLAGALGCYDSISDSITIRSEIIDAPYFPLTLFHEAVHAHDSELFIKSKLLSLLLLRKTMSGLRNIDSLLDLEEARAEFAEGIFRYENGLRPDRVTTFDLTEGRFTSRYTKARTIMDGILTHASIAAMSGLLISAGLQSLGGFSQGSESMLIFGAAMGLGATYFLHRSKWNEEKNKCKGAVMDQLRNLWERGGQIGHVESFRESTQKLIALCDSLMPLYEKDGLESHDF